MEPMKPKAQERIQEAYQGLINALHEELGWFDQEALTNTSRRYKDFIKEWVEDNDFNFTAFAVDEATTKSMVVLREVDFYSMCSHHMLPFFGTARIAYLPKEGGKVCGISKLARAVKKFANQPQIQEGMTNEIADFLMKELEAWFVMVVVEGTHMCMTMRGIKQHASVMGTSAIRWNKEKFTSEDDIGHLKEEAMTMFRMR